MSDCDFSALNAALATFREKRKSEEISPAPAAASAAAAKKAVVVPADLSALSNGELQGLVRDLDEERKSLGLQLAAATQKASAAAKKKARRPAPISTSAAASAAAAPAATVVTPTAKEVAAVQKRLGKNVERAVKKLKFGNRKKPTCEVSEGNMSPEMVASLMTKYSASRKSDTKKMTKWTLTDDADVAALLQTKRLIHPVKFDGKVWSFGGVTPKIYCWAGYDQCEVKYDKSQRNFTVKVKCFEAGTGRPEHAAKLVAYADGVGGAKPDPDDDDSDY
jgi:hypothetical protein